MNKAITDGLVLTPPPFSSGLAVWSSGDGTPGSATYDGAANAAIVPSDQDFGSCLELLKTTAVQKLRHMGQTPVVPGCYLRITARVKAVSGNLPTVQIAAFAANGAGVAVPGLVTTGPAVTLTAYGQVATVSAIVGTGARGGVQMVWNGAVYGHFGLDLTGPTGGSVRIDDIEIEDITSAFLRTMMDWVDVRDYGARGDGVTDDRAAFVAADAAAAGRSILVPAGDYRIGSSLTLTSPVRFEGRLVAPDAARIVLSQNYNLIDYIDAFGGDETLAFRKALQVLFNYADHDSFDMRGRTVDITAPIDVQAAVGNRDVFAVRRVLRNGMISVGGAAAWDPVVATSQASYSAANPTQLTGVANVANVPVGALVTGIGVGREVYVRARNVATGTLTLSQPLHAAAGTQVFTFTRFQYALDFSNFASLDRFQMEEVEIQCNGLASGILLPPDGSNFQMSDCYITRPRHRAMTSHGAGCAGLQLNRCQFISNEQDIRVQDRVSLAFNTNGNDVKIRECRMMRFGVGAVLAGANNLILGNHIFNGDDETLGVRLPGLVLTAQTSKSTITGNYIDNCYIEVTNEHDPEPDHNNEFSFGALSITGNVFLAMRVAASFRWIVLKPFGPGHFIDGLSVVGNMFHSVGGTVPRVEDVDTSFAVLDMGRARNVLFEGNSFNNVAQRTSNPVTLAFTQGTAQSAWTCDFAGWLPFGGRARVVEGIVAEGMITNASNGRVAEMPFVDLEQGAGGSQVRLNWSTGAKGRVRLVARMDTPLA